MNAVYTDIHIHTSDNPNQLNFDYDVDLLVQNIKRQSASKPTLVSLTDHNAINKNAYIRLARYENVHPILGVELHTHEYEIKTLIFSAMLTATSFTLIYDSTFKQTNII